MKPLLILLTPAAPTVGYPCWYTLWCTSSVVQLRPSAVDGICRHSPAPVSPLCLALLAVQSFSSLTPVMLSTTGELPSLPEDPRRATADLDGDDVGTLWFPHAELLIRCAQNAIRARDPEAGPTTLLDLWHQVLLADLTDDV